MGRVTVRDSRGRTLRVPAEIAQAYIEHGGELVEEDQAGAESYRRHAARHALPEETLVVEQPAQVALPFDPSDYAIGKAPYEGPLAQALTGVADPEQVQAMQRVDTRKGAAKVYEWRLDQLSQEEE